MTVSIATEGLSPSVFSHSLLAKLGFGYNVEITIVPVADSGGPAGVAYPDLRQYLITVKIRKKDKQWSYSMEANMFEMKTLERVILTFKKVETVIHNIKLSIVSKSINIHNIIVKAFKK